MSDTSPIDHLPSWLLTRAATRSHRIVHDHLAAAGFTGYDYRILAALAHSGLQSQADIGRAVHLDRRDVTHTVRQLDQRGLVRRGPHPTNRRSVLVELTATGRHAWQEVDQVMHTVQAELLAPLTPTQAATFVALLARLGDGSGATANNPTAAHDHTAAPTSHGDVHPRADHHGEPDAIHQPTPTTTVEPR